MLIKNREIVGLKYYKDPKSYIEYSNYVICIHKNVDKHNLEKKVKYCLSLILLLL